jgi:hypothetical protein
LEAGKRQEERKCMEQREKINRLCTLFGCGEKKSRNSCFYGIIET